MTIKQFSNRVAIDTRKDGVQQVFIDPLTITIICSIASVLFAAIRTWIAYRKAKNEEERANNGVKAINLVSSRSFLLNWRVGKIVKKNLGKERYKKEGKYLINSIFNTIENSSPQEIGQLLEEDKAWTKL